MAPPASSRLTRRRFLGAGSVAAGAVLLGACGGGDDDASDDVDDPTSTTGGRGLALAAFFGGPLFVAGSPMRAPFGVADRDGLLLVEDTPDELELTILDRDDEVVGDPITVARHDEGLPRGYFPLTTTLDEPGFYVVRTEIDGESAELALEVKAPAEVAVIQPGAAMPALETPTAADARGVDPICTRDPVCPLHDVTLAEALTAGSPIAYLVSTPGFCQIAICGPVLDVLLEATGAHPGVKLLHQEVYANPHEDLTTFAPGLAELGLHFEPCLILAGADGTVAERLDVIFDASELDASLARLTA